MGILRHDLGRQRLNLSAVVTHFSPALYGLDDGGIDGDVFRLRGSGQNSVDLVWDANTTSGHTRMVSSGHGNDSALDDADRYLDHVDGEAAA